MHLRAALIAGMLVLPAAAQTPSKPAGTGIEAADAAPRPFQLLEGQVVTTVTVGGREVLALVDTGSERSMIEAGLAGELGLKTKMPRGGNFGASGKPTNYARTDMVEMVVGGRTRRPSLAVFPSGSAFAAREVRILLGRDILEAVAIDFEHMTIELTSSATFIPPDTASGGSPLKLVDRPGWGGPVMQIDVNGKPADVVLDTAATGSLYLTSTFMRNAGLTAGRQTSTKTITGIDGSYERKAVVLPTVTIAGGTFENVEATILTFGQVGRSSNPIDGVVGVGLLSRFNLTIDFGSNRVWLTPNRRTPG